MLSLAWLILRTLAALATGVAKITTEKSSDNRFASCEVKARLVSGRPWAAGPGNRGEERERQRDYPACLAAAQLTRKNPRPMAVELCVDFSRWS